MNFNNWKSRCHSLGYLMQEPDGKSNAEIYEELLIKRNSVEIKLDKKYKEYNEMPNKMTKGAQEALQQCERYSEILTSLDANIKYYLEIRGDIKLSGTAMSHLMDIYIFEKYGRRKIIKSKYLEKGNDLEEDAITMISLQTNIILFKNTVRVSNDWIEGEWDVEENTEEIIIDTKVSWDIFTFFANLPKPIKKIYDWQIRGYMWLKGYKKGKLCYTLIDTPAKFIEREKENLFKSWIGSEVDYLRECEQIEKNMTYGDIPQSEKIITFNITHDEEMIEKIPPVIKKCREFLNNIPNLKLSL